MDTSKKYIQLCEKAQEIQDLWQYDDGDFYLHRFTDRNIREERFKDMIGKEIVSNICCACNVEDSYGSLYVSEYNPKGENVWLPRQDQLYDFLLKDRGILELLIDLRDFCDPLDRLGTMPLPVAVREAVRKEAYAKQFVTLEQMLLAFAMKENFQKIWDGEQWISR